MKKRLVVSVIEIIMIFSLLCACGKNTYIKDTEKAIEAIGVVTLDNEAAINYAEKLYNILTEEEKSKVQNKQILLKAREKFNNLKEKEKKEEVSELLLGMWGLEIPTNLGSLASVYTFNKGNAFSFQNIANIDGAFMTIIDETGKYAIDIKNSIIKLEYDNKDKEFLNEIPFSLENGKFMFYNEDYIHIKKNKD